MATKFDVAAVRKHFPALDKQQVYFDNAGGSQILGEVVESYVFSNAAITKHVRHLNICFQHLAILVIK